MLDFIDIDKFSIELYTFHSVNALFRSLSFQIHKKMGTLGKFRTYQKRVSIFN